VFWQARHPAYPDVPIARELGATREVPPGHNGLYAPSGLPIATKTALERHCRDAVKSEVVRHIISNTGQSVRFLSGAEFQAQTIADYRFKGELIQRLGLGAQ
jgi:tripartite-type tricarboxylate transporter receptor subunit TctC